MAIVYKITNTVNGKSYIGATEKTLEERWNGHVKSATVNNKDWVLSRAIRKYGPDAFTREVLEEHPDRKYTFDVLEPKYILKHNTFGNGYNMTGGSEGGVGHKHSEETKRKIRESVMLSYLLNPRKQQLKMVSDETRKKISNALTGRKLSQITIEKLRIAHKGKKLSEKTKQKMKIAASKRTHTPETKEKLREAGLKRTHTPETKEKLREAGLKRTHTPETKEKLRLANIGRKFSNETREKMRLAKVDKKYTKEHKEKLKLANIGKKHSLESKKKMKESWAKRKASKSEDFDPVWVVLAR